MRRRVDQYTSYDEDLTRELLQLRSFVDTCTASEMNGSNVDHLVRGLGKIEFDGHLYLGPCMAQIRRYKQHLLQRPPEWHVGHTSRPGITSSAAADAFRNFLLTPAVAHYRKLCDEPQTEHHFLPGRFTKGDPFYGTTVHFATYLKCDEFLANQWMQYYDVAQLGQSELPWF